MTETPQPTIEYARRSVLSGMAFLGQRRAIFVNGQEVGRLDAYANGTRGLEWLVIWGGDVGNWQHWRVFPNRAEAVAFAETNAAELLAGKPPTRKSDGC